MKFTRIAAVSLIALVLSVPLGLMARADGDALPGAPTPEQVTTSKLVYGLLSDSRYAYRPRPLDATMSSEIFDHYLEALDGSKLFFTAQDIARFRVLITSHDDESPFDALDRGEIPKLTALQLHNGTVYRWNRVCYGIGNGVPHLRIENRILPAGPSVLDEVANAAFWFGLVSGIANQEIDVTQQMAFDDAKSNFVAAARLGLASQLTWFSGERHPAHELILRELLPLARWGLSERGIDEADVDRYLGIIEQRVATRCTGSQWQLDSLAQMKKHGTRAERLEALVLAMMENQQAGLPCHEWPLASFSHMKGSGRVQRSRVEHFMTTDLFTVNEEELVEFVACIMDWRKIRHVLVEDRDHALVGLVTHRILLRYLAERPPDNDPAGVPVKDVMLRDPIAVSPETPTGDAIALMRRHRIGSLPVVRDGQLVGIVTESDFMEIAGRLLDDEA